MFIIGIDPHKGSHTAAVLDRTETVIGELRVVADRRQRDRLLCFAADFTPRTWAIEPPWVRWRLQTALLRARGMAIDAGAAFRVTLPQPQVRRLIELSETEDYLLPDE